MSETTSTQVFVNTILSGLEETFEHVQGIYLDENTSLFETLATLTAEQVSIPASDGCASIATHVAHMSVSIEATMQYMRGERPQVDWTEAWRTVRKVTPDEWEAHKSRLSKTYQYLCDFIRDEDLSDGNMKLLMGITLHSAYHLGEIRQMLCTVQSD